MKKRLEKLYNTLKESGYAKDCAMLAAAAFALLLSFARICPWGFDPGWLTILLCGLPIIHNAWCALIDRLDIKADFLVSLALIAAIAIEEVFAAAEISFIMQLGTLLEAMTVTKTKGEIEKLVSLAPQTARLLLNGEAQIITAQAVQAGDLLRVLPGETVPVDGTLLDGETSVDEAVMTGEAVPVDKAEGDSVLAGTINRYGAFTMRATRSGADSSLSRMIALVRNADAGKAKIVGIADRWATRIVFLALLAACATWLYTGHIIRAVTVLVVFCPCSLVLATPTAVMAAIGNATRNHFLVREGDALERLAQVNKFVFDKTGTLTYGRMQVTGVSSVNDSYAAETLYKLAASAESLSEHPLGQAITRCYLEKNATPLLPCDKFRMLPGLGVKAELEGQELVLGNEKLLERCGLSLTAQIFSKTVSMARRGASIVYISLNQSLAGFIALADTARPQMRSLLKSLHMQGVSTAMLTGDSAPAAQSVADLTGVQDFRSACLPEDKVSYIRSLQEDGQLLAMVGDGINDAPALKTAHVGIAMGGIGSDIAIEAADIIIMKDNILKLPHLFALSKRMLMTIKGNLIFSLALNFAAIALAMAGLLSPVAGALVHNVGSIIVIINAILLLNWQSDDSARPPRTAVPQAVKAENIA